MKKGFTKFWIEIIGGIIIVVVILLVVVYFGSAITTGVEDARNKQAFNDLRGAMTKAMSQGEEAISPFKLDTGVDDRFYAIVFLPPDTVDCLLDPVTCVGIHPAGISDEVSKYNIKKCGQAEIQGSSSPTDMCMCLLRIDYACSQKGYNFISGTAGTTAQTDKAAVTAWGNSALLEAFDEDDEGYSPIKTIAVLDCALLIGDNNCIYTGPSGGDEYPCLLHYDGKTVFWLAGSGGWWNLDTPLYAEVIALNRQTNKWYLDMELTNSKGDFYAGANSPCDCVRCLG